MCNKVITNIQSHLQRVAELQVWGLTSANSPFLHHPIYISSIILYALFVLVVVMNIASEGLRVALRWPRDVA